MNTIRTKPGRPESSENQDREGKILDVAEDLFANQGFAATSIRQIADQATVNPALVHYYFKNKKSLLSAVIERVFHPLAQSIAQLDTSKLFDSVIELLISTMQQHPNLPRLMVREAILPGGVFRREFAERYAPHIGGALPGLIHKEQEAGRIKTDLSPGISALHILALCAFPFIAAPLAEEKLHVKFSPDGIEQLKQQTMLLLKEGYLI